MRFIPDSARLTRHGFGTCKRWITVLAFGVLPAAFRTPAKTAMAVPTTESQGPVQASQSRGTVPAPDLGPLLAKAAEYCGKLENAAFDFVCREEISETIDPSLDFTKRPDLMGGWSWSSGGSSRSYVIWRDVKHTYVYDYQCARAGREIREMRTLLKENGKDMNESNAALKTSVVVFGTALIGPVGLLGERFQPDYDYTVIGHDKIGKTKVLVIDAHPKPGAPESRNLYGKAWIDPVTADILRIDWSDSRVGRFDVFKKRGEHYKRTPRLNIRSEFSAEKNGIRFPSRLYIEEAYLNDAGRAVVRSKTDVRYKDFKFFKVAVEVTY